MIFQSCSCVYKDSGCVNFALIGTDEICNTAKIKSKMNINCCQIMINNRYI